MFPGLECTRVLASWGIVVMHVWVALGGPRDLSWIIRLRAWALPFFILTAAFFLARGVMRRPERPFGELALRRVSRLGLPFVFWTVVTGLFVKLLPWLEWPRITILRALAGGSHLWFLLFLVCVSLPAFPILRALVRRGRLGHCAAIACVGMAVLWLGWLQEPLASLTWEMQPMILRPFARRCVMYLPYVPLGIACAIWAEPIRRLLSSPRVWTLALLVMVAATGNYLLTGPGRWSRAGFGVAVFLMVIGPFPLRAAVAMRLLIKHTYAVYALHVLVIAFARHAILQSGIAITAPVLIGTSMLVFGCALAAGVMLEAVPGLRWILPLVPVRSQSPT